MSATSLSEVAETDCMEVEFSRLYPQKQFLADATRLKTLVRKRVREPVTAGELAEVPELRGRLRRADGDAVAASPT